MMPETIDIFLAPDELHNVEAIRRAAAKKLGIAPKNVPAWRVERRSIDARGREVKFLLRLSFGEGKTAEESIIWRNVTNAPEVIVVGSGPAGLFAALRLIELGYKPIVLERGKDVRERRRDLAALNKSGEVNPESNYCFGEGGAGTYSDGKLYTRSTKRGDTRRILDRLVAFGASDEILIEVHPHIGTNKLPNIIAAIRDKIRECGGEVRFDSRVTDFRVKENALQAVQINSNEWLSGKAVILATGHSARDIFTLLHQSNIFIEAKPFALGVRVEHPQAIIDRIQYHCPTERHPNLPAASYALVKQVQDRGVYSFCMCPGGIICPAATDAGEVVVNGWSPSKRNNPYANSGIVVELSPEDFSREVIRKDTPTPLLAMEFQAQVERAAFVAGGGKVVAPASRLADFAAGKLSADLPKCSYQPGITPVDMRSVLPKFIHDRLRDGFKLFGKSMHGYLTNEAVIVGVESRTSSPVRIPRQADTLMHPQISGLFPCGEGAGYAGGIMSAAIDGEKCAEAAVRFLSL